MLTTLLTIHRHTQCTMGVHSLRRFDPRQTRLFPSPLQETTLADRQASCNFTSVTRRKQLLSSTHSRDSDDDTTHLQRFPQKGSIFLGSVELPPSSQSNVPSRPTSEGSHSPKYLRKTRRTCPQVAQSVQRNGKHEDLTTRRHAP